MKKEYVPITGLNLTKNNLRKINKGENTIIKSEHLKGGNIEIFLSPMKAKKIQKAMTKGKGVKVSMSKDELDHSVKHGKGVVLPTRKIRVPPREGKNEIMKKGVMIHASKVKALNVGNDTFDVVRGDPLQVDKGGKINLKKIGRQLKGVVDKVKDDYKEFRDNPKNAGTRKIIQQGAKQAIKSAIVSGATALGSTVGMPQAGLVGATIADPLANMAVDKIGLGTKQYMLNDNFNTFLNPMHPAQNPTLPMGDHSISTTLKGQGFRAPGYTSGGRLRRSELNNIQPVGTPLNPTLPQSDHSIPRSM
jgi:hypothetical protein